MRLSSVVVAMVVLFCNTANAGTEPQPTFPGTYALRKDLEWCGPRPSHGGEFYPGLDDSQCAKVFPKVFDREFVCPARHAQSEGFTGVQTSVSNVEVDDTAFDRVLDPHYGIRAAVAVIHRASNELGSVSMRFLGSAARQPYQPWSSSKLFAAYDAAARLRNGSDQQLGLRAIESRSGISLGDFATIITSYDVTRNLSSNALGGYFHSVGQHVVALRAAQEWIGAGGNSSFGGNYGAPLPSQLGFTFESQNSTLPSQRVSVEPDPVPSPPLPNSMNALTMAEWMRRIVLAREDQAMHVNFSDFPQYTHMPQWPDSQHLLYGALPRDSTFTVGLQAGSSDASAGLQWGGASMSTDIYLQQAINATLGFSNMTTSAADMWRIFSKLGAGQSSSRGVSEITLNAYACLPVMNTTSGEPVPNRGLEFTISVYAPMPYTGHVNVPRTDTFAQLDMLMTEAITNITAYLVREYY